LREKANIYGNTGRTRQLEDKKKGGNEYPKNSRHAAKLGEKSSKKEGPEEWESNIKHKI